MSKIQRLNYGSEFCDSLRDHEFTPEFSAVRGHYEAVAEELSRGQTFLLPDNGVYIVGRSSIPTEFADNFRLPFPITAFEYKKVNSDNSVYKKLLLAIEDTVEDSKRRRIVVIEATGVDGQGWMLNPIMSFWNQGHTQVMTAELYEQQRQDHAALKIISPGGKAEVIEIGSTFIDFRTHKMFSNPGFDTLDDNRKDGGTAMVSIHNVAYACLIMSCRNVKVIDVPLTPGDLYMNERRVRKGKTPFVEYKVLQLGDKNIYANDHKGTHESPKWHMVMGFVRRLTDDKYYTAGTPMEERTRTTFVAAHARGNADKGKVIKDYQIKGESDES